MVEPKMHGVLKMDDNGKCIEMSIILLVVVVVVVVVVSSVVISIIMPFYGP